MRSVATGKGASLATESLGSPDKGTFLLVMGATASMLWWPQSLMRALADGGYQVIRFDHRDTGQSTTLPLGEGNYDLADMADDVLAILDAYDIEAAHLVGMSLGGLLSQITALQYPDRVLSVTLIASEPINTGYEEEGLSPEFQAHFGAMDSIDWSDKAAAAGFLLRVAELSAGSAVPFDAEAARRRIDAELARTDSIQSAFNHASVTGDTDGLALSELTQPVLVVHGTEDPIISINAGRKIAETAPNATLLVLDRRGHELLEQDMPAIAAAILKLCGSAATTSGDYP